MIKAVKLLISDAIITITITVYNRERMLYTCCIQHHRGMGVEAQQFFKRTAEKITMKEYTPYPQVMSFVRRRVRSVLVKMTLIAPRGH